MSARGIIVLIIFTKCMIHLILICYSNGSFNANNNQQRAKIIKIMLLKHDSIIKRCVGCINNIVLSPLWTFFIYSIEQKKKKNHT